MKKTDFNLYLITDRKLVCSSRLPVNSQASSGNGGCCTALVAAVEEALKAGIKAVQLREKDLLTRELLQIAYEIKGLTEKYNAMLFINDRLDIALCTNADGVHLGQASIPVYAVRQVVGDKMLIGVSTHSLQEAVSAEGEGADFITYGPLYETPSKVKYGQPVGLESLKTLRERVSIPVFGIGGIKPEKAKNVIDAGAHGIALISGILGEADIKSAAEKYIKILD